MVRSSVIHTHAMLTFSSDKGKARKGRAEASGWRRGWGSDIRGATLDAVHFARMHIWSDAATAFHYNMAESVTDNSTKPER